MGIIAGIIALAILAIALIILLPMFSDQFTQTTETFYKKVEAGEIGNNAKIGDVVCDLKITFYGELDFANQDARTVWFANPFETNLVVFMNDNTAHPEIAQYEWKNCYEHGKFSLLSLFDGVTGLELMEIMANEDKLSKLDVSGIALNDSFTLTIQGENNNGDLIIDKFRNTDWSKRIVIDDGTQIKIPYAFQARFTLSDVVYDNYTIEVNAIGKSINNNPSNQPLIYHVVK